MNSLQVAIQFLTRLPAPWPTVNPDARTLGRSALFYPLVGVLIGGLLYIPAAWFSGVDSWLLAALLLSAWVWLTGGLHIDGLADSADAWAGGQGDRERILRIMKDPCSGPAGVSSIVLLLIVKFAALGALLGASTASSWWLVPVVGRAVLLAMLLSLPYARPGGLGAAISANLPADQARLVLAATAVVVVLFGGWDGVKILISSAILLLILYRTLQSRLGGTTGDTLGAGVEITEVLALVVLAL